MIELLYTLVMTHITIVCVTLYLHRGQAHKGIIFHPILSHFMRFWLWLTTGMVTKQWVAIHRKHHRYSDEPGDPHSPHVFGIFTVLFGGALLYHKAGKDEKLIRLYGKTVSPICIFFAGPPSKADLKNYCFLTFYFINQDFR